MPVRTNLVFFSIYSLATTSENYTIKCKISLEFLLPMDIYTSSWTGHRNHKKMQHPPADPLATDSPSPPTNLVNLPWSKPAPPDNQEDIYFYIGGLTDWLADWQTLKSKTEAVGLWIIY